MDEELAPLKPPDNDVHSDKFESKMDQYFLDNKPSTPSGRPFQSSRSWASGIPGISSPVRKQ